jgi:hypothetical protein
VKPARWRRGKAEEGAEGPGVAVIEANVAADANDGRLLLPSRMESYLLTSRSFPSRVVKEKRTASFYGL